MSESSAPVAEQHVNRVSGTSPKAIREAAVSAYNGWITVQNQETVPSVQELRDQLTPYIARRERLGYAYKLRNALKKVKRTAGPLEPALVMRVVPTTWLKLDRIGDEAFVAFIGYTEVERVDVPLHNTPDQRFTVSLRRSGNVWKMTADKSAWLDARGPTGNPHVG